MSFWKLFLSRSAKILAVLGHLFTKQTRRHRNQQRFHLQWAGYPSTARWAPEIASEQDASSERRRIDLSSSKDKLPVLSIAV